LLFYNINNNNKSSRSPDWIF